MKQNLAGQSIAVIGGGLIGLYRSHYLSLRGAEVVIVERKQLGSGAARGNGGLLVWTEATPLAAPGVVSHTLRHIFSRSSPFFVKPSALMANASFLYRFARNCTADSFRQGLARMDFLNVRTERLYAELKEHGIATAVSNTGILRVFRSKPAADDDRDMVKALVERGLSEQPGPMLGGSELHEFEPALGPAAQWAFMQNGEAFTNPSVLVDQLIASLRSRGIEARENTAAIDVAEDRGGVRILTAGGEVKADKCLVAMGAWSRDLAARLGLRITLVPGKGYSFSVEPAVMPKRAMAFGDAHAGATPLGGGKLRLAGTMEFDGTYDRFNANRIEAIKTSSANYLSGVDWTKSSQEWVAPRPMTPDGAPYIGLVPGRTATFIAAGHNMLGLSLGPATGSVVAEMMAGEASPDLLQALSPTR